MAPAIYIWTRATTAWEDEATVMAQLRPDMRPHVDLWNATLSIPFHLFRNRVREIARTSLSKVEDVVCAEWEDIPEGALVVPIDDDDWLAPHLGGTLQHALAPDAEVYYWTRSFVERPLTLGHSLGKVRDRIFPGWPPKFTCASSSYAVVKNGGARALAESHTRVSEWVDNDDGAKAVRVERRLSVNNRTLGSQTTLLLGRWTSTRAGLLWKLRRYRTLYGHVPHPELAWCAPYMRMMSDLMDELTVRNRR